MARGPAIRVEGLREFNRELRGMDTDLRREVRKANRDAADLIATRSRFEAAGGTKQQAKAARGITARGSVSAGKVAVGGARNPFAIGAFFGAKQYDQFPEWVGNQWQPGENGGPYVIGPVIRRDLDDVIEKYGEAIDEITRRAFPERG